MAAQPSERGEGRGKGPAGAGAPVVESGLEDGDDSTSRDGASGASEAKACEAEAREAVAD